MSGNENQWKRAFPVDERLDSKVGAPPFTTVANRAGGVSGYERFLEIIADREDPEYAETIRWCGGCFDPEWFDLSIADKDLRNALRSNVKRRLYQPRPKAVPKE
ncbi:DNA-binding transcriptional MocR family regulator [Rhizobium mongolense]|uniref:DNA-binding transcriptional MocR family regulator n=1 Tax=Rhizobium mongolense TaxID=57676 RepID=A0ABR6IGB5_9HYPH|nr:DNA-binding transcriptional MocR family regulator [Rhizobium mongolense]